MPNAAERDLLRSLKPGLRILDHGALNAEATPDLLDEPLTPIPAFFVRNNGFLPELPVTADRWTLTVDGATTSRLFALGTVTPVGRATAGNRAATGKAGDQLYGTIWSLSVSLG